jgi:hypothetical protein
MFLQLVEEELANEVSIVKLHARHVVVNVKLNANEVSLAKEVLNEVSIVRHVAVNVKLNVNEDCN